MKKLAKGDPPKIKKLTPIPFGYGGTISGATTGASIGTAIMPGVGTAVGAVLGAGLGYMGDRKQNIEEERIKKEQDSLEAKNRANSDRIYMANYPVQGYLNKSLYGMGGSMKQLASNSALVQGASHEEGGVDLNSNVEVEGNEVVRNNPFTGQTEVDSDRLGTADVTKQLSMQKGILEKYLIPLKQKAFTIKNTSDKSGDYYKKKEYARELEKLAAKIDPIEAKILEIDTAIEQAFAEQEAAKEGTGLEQPQQEMALGGTPKQFNGVTKSLDNEIASQAVYDIHNNGAWSTDIEANKALVKEFRKGKGTITKGKVIAAYGLDGDGDNPFFQNDPNLLNSSIVASFPTNIPSTHNLMPKKNIGKSSNPNILDLPKDEFGMIKGSAMGDIEFEHDKRVRLSKNQITPMTPKSSSKVLVNSAPPTQLSKIETGTATGTGTATRAGSRISSQQVGDVLTKVTPYLDNIVNLGLTLATPKIPKPNLVKPAPMETNYDITASEAKTNSQLAASKKALAGSVADSNSSIAAQSATDVAGLHAKNAMYQTKANEEVKLKNQAKLNAQNVEAANAAKIDDYNTKRVARIAGMQQDVSQNVANVESNIKETITNTRLDQRDDKVLALQRLIAKSQGNELASDYTEFALNKISEEELVKRLRAGGHNDKDIQERLAWIKNLKG